MECFVAILIETETSVQNWQNPAPGVFSGMPHARLSTIFRREKTCDFLFAFQLKKLLEKKEVYLKKGRIFSSAFRVDLYW